MFFSSIVTTHQAFSYQDIIIDRSPWTVRTCQSSWWTVENIGEAVHHRFLTLLTNILYRIVEICFEQTVSSKICMKPQKYGHAMFINNTHEKKGNIIESLCYSCDYCKFTARENMLSNVISVNNNRPRQEYWLPDSHISVAIRSLAKRCSNRSCLGGWSGTQQGTRRLWRTPKKADINHQRGWIIVY